MRTEQRLFANRWIQNLNVVRVRLFSEKMCQIQRFVNQCVTKTHYNITGCVSSISFSFVRPTPYRRNILSTFIGGGALIRSQAEQRGGTAQDHRWGWLGAAEQGQRQLGAV